MWKNKEGAPCADAPLFRLISQALHHAVHAAGRAVAAAAAGILLLGDVGDHAVGREQEPRDGRGVLQSRARDLRRIDDAGLEHVGVLASADVVAVRASRLLDVGDDERGLLAWPPGLRC